MAGVAGLIVIGCPDVVPPDVVTVIDRWPMSATASTVSRAVIDVALAMVTSLTAMFDPLTATALPVTNPVPVSVMVVAEPLINVPGVTPVNVGATTAGGVVVTTGGVGKLALGAVGESLSQAVSASMAIVTPAADRERMRLRIASYCPRKGPISQSNLSVMSCLVRTQFSIAALLLFFFSRGA